MARGNVTMRRGAKWSAAVFGLGLLMAVALGLVYPAMAGPMPIEVSRQRLEELCSDQVNWVNIVLKNGDSACRTLPGRKLSINTASRLEVTGEAAVLIGSVINAISKGPLVVDGISFPFKLDGTFEVPVSIVGLREKTVQLAITDSDGARATATTTIVRKAAEPPLRPVPLPQAGRRFALLMGNADYKLSGWEPLPAVINDLAGMAAALRDLGYEVTIAPTNLSDRTEMKAEVVRFKERVLKAGSSATVLFYYSGHGISADGASFLVPSHAPDPASVPSALLSDRYLAVNEVLSLLQDSDMDGRTTLLLLDACRDSGFSAIDTRRFGAGYPMRTGNTALFFAASLGEKASAGMSVSPFTAAVLNELRMDRITAPELNINVGRVIKRAEWVGPALPDLVFQRAGR